MMNLPVLHRLRIDDYGLYPGTKAKPGIDIEFKPGLTLVLGANGLGKTTLVTILFRMLTGPVDIPNINVGGELGDRRLEPRPLTARDRATFANRVRDGAQDSLARLNYSLGEDNIEVARRLSDMSIVNLRNNVATIAPEEGEYERVVLAGARLSSYSDWILALRHLTFYFEDRRVLVWDPTAQRQLLRLLFLPPDEASAWSSREREILELDSSYRNLLYMVGREERLAAKAERAMGSEDEVRQQLSLLQEIQAAEQNRLTELNDELVNLVSDRQTARLDSLNADQSYEAAKRNVERLQLQVIAEAFPDADETGRYIIGHIVSDDECLTCGAIVPELAREVRARIQGGLCPVCSTPYSDHKRSGFTRSLNQATEHARAAEEQREASAARRAAAEKNYDEVLGLVSSLNASIARRTADINGLLKRLPPDQRKDHEQRSDLVILRGRLEEQKAALTSMRAEFQIFIADVTQKISDRKDAIKDAFDGYATDFLFEHCNLKWTPLQRRIGQTGELIEFAAFEVDMTGADFASPVVRSGPQQVSESQREFIDLSFRMALMSVASESGGSLVIDAPESSLDAVFVSRAADVLTRFGAPENSNRLVITSNLVDGNLIPGLLRRASIKTPRDARIVDLLRLAAPTAATKALHSEYQSIRRQLFERAWS